VAARRLWNLGTRCIAEFKNFSVAAEMLARLNAAVGRDLLALEKQAQQTIEAATVVGVHGCKLDGHSFGRSDPADHPSSAYCADSGR
jgi:hypothetical protein